VWKWDDRSDGLGLVERSLWVPRLQEHVVARMKVQKMVSLEAETAALARKVKPNFSAWVRQQLILDARRFFSYCEACDIGYNGHSEALERSRACDECEELTQFVGSNLGVKE